MANLKPRLMMTQTGRKRRGFGKLLFLVIIFAAGFYAGSKYGDSFFEYIGGQNSSDTSQIAKNNKASKGISEKEEPPGEDNSIESYIEPQEQEINKQDSLSGTLIPGQSEFSSPASFQNDVDVNDDDTGNDIILAQESGHSIEIDSALDSSLPADNSEEAAKTKGLYTLQVAAFSTPDEANSVAKEYIAKGYEAYVVPIDNSRGETWNLVKIGKFNTIEQAWSYSAYFKNREGAEAYVESLEQETVFNESWQNSGQAEIE